MLRLLLHTTESPAHDLALEEAIHLSVEDGSALETWRLWQAAQPAVILGTGQESAREADLAAAAAEDIPVLRRHSGGGAVLIGPGAINFSFFFRYPTLPGSETIRGAMHAALTPVRELLGAWGLEVREAGLSDLAVLCADGTLRKIAGNSQARKRVSAVVHGTLLAAPDWQRLGRVLRFPSSTPDYRAGRGHREFLTSLKEHGAPTDLTAIAEGLLSRLPSDILVAQAPDSTEAQRAAELLQEKYARAEWNLRR